MNQCPKSHPYGDIEICEQDLQECRRKRCDADPLSYCLAEEVTLRSMSTSDLTNFIRPEAIKLLTAQELSDLKEWLAAFREANLTDSTMLCIPPKSKELQAAIKRVAAKVIEDDMLKLSSSPDVMYKKSPRVPIWNDLGLKVHKL